MSRIGKQLITLPPKVTCACADGMLTVSGPLGTLSRVWPRALQLNLTGETVTITPVAKPEEHGALWGTYGAHLRNMVAGVTSGFTKQLIIEGVGYRATLAGEKLTFALGLSHPVELAIPKGLKVVVDKGNLTISGADKEALGQFAAKIRALKPPEPYKGKGIRYATETIRRKVGKKVAAA